MEKDPPYENYSLAELLEVQENIDRDKHPKRAAKVDTEIVRRHKNGEKIKKQYDLDDDEDDEDDESNELILDFQGDGRQTLRWLFLATVILLHIGAIGWISHQLSIPKHTDLPDYLINVERARCSSKGSGDTRYYDFVVQSYGYQFYAVDIRRSLCHNLAKSIEQGSDVKIWHLDGIIFHMEQDDKVLISHNYLRSNYRGNRMSHLDHWVAIALIFWAVFFKSFINALRPGTFVKAMFPLTVVECETACFH
jgi:hypothetical protein